MVEHSHFCGVSNINVVDDDHKSANLIQIICGVSDQQAVFAKFPTIRAKGNIYVAWKISNL